MSKLTYEDKINLYNDKKRGMSIGSLSNKYKIRKSVINYLTALIDKHGIDILRTSKNKIHTTLIRVNNNDCNLTLDSNNKVILVKNDCCQFINNLTSL